MFKLHDRWETNAAKDIYVDEGVYKRLEITNIRALGMYRFNFTSRTRLMWYNFYVDVVVTFPFTPTPILDVKKMSLLEAVLFKIVTHVFDICKNKLVLLC